MLINCRLTGSSTEQSTQEGGEGNAGNRELDGSVGEWEVGWQASDKPENGAIIWSANKL